MIKTVEIRRKTITGFSLAFAWFILIAAQLGCTSTKQPRECAEFFAKESTNGLREFANYSLEKQLIIHRCGLDMRPRYDFSYEIADRGDVIVPILLQELARDNYQSHYEADKSKYATILIFQRLASRGQLDNNENVIRTIENAVSEIQTEWIKEKADESLSEIKTSTTRLR